MIFEEKLNELDRYVNDFKTIKYEKVNEDSRFLSIQNYNCYLNCGRVLTREKLLKGNKDGSAVIIVPRLKNGEYLMVVEPRVFTKNSVALSFPAGYIEENEKSTSAAIRELKEETGYTVRDKSIKLLDSYYQDEGVSSAYNYIYLFDGCIKVSDQKLDESEMIKYMSFNLDELYYLEQKGYICGVNSKLALRYLKK